PQTCNQAATFFETGGRETGGLEASIAAPFSDKNTTFTTGFTRAVNITNSRSRPLIFSGFYIEGSSFAST
ncbi:MAG TPA: hypothetical protein VFN23_19900, partial [Ktedonobacteraceae bacterium]|nr:hypothetical protein [Ktedonobacteraceae bacterium]